MNTVWIWCFMSSDGKRFCLFIREIYVFVHESELLVCRQSGICTVTFYYAFETEENFSISFLTAYMKRHFHCYKIF